jgi:hypothetical protein
MTTEQQREHKDTLFRYLFSKTENIVELYAALTGRKLSDRAIEIVTLIDPDGKSRNKPRNDVAFVAEDKLVVLWEHKSSPNQNMPLRFLQYLAAIYKAKGSARGPVPYIGTKVFCRLRRRDIEGGA